jgi:hypothetical protein
LTDWSANLISGGNSHLSDTSSLDGRIWSRGTQKRPASLQQTGAKRASDKRRQVRRQDCADRIDARHTHRALFDLYEIIGNILYRSSSDGHA